MTNLILYDYQGTKIGTLVQAQGIKYGFKLNDFVPLEFTYNFNNINPNLRDNLIHGSEVRVERDGTLVYAGEIQHLKKKVTNEGAKNEEEMKDRKKEIQFTVRHWGEVFLSKRYATISFTSTEEKDILEGVLNYINTDTSIVTADQADTGLTFGTSDDSGNIRDRTYDKDNVLKIWQQLMNVLDTSGNPQRFRCFRVSPEFRFPDSKVVRYEPIAGEQVEDFTYKSPSIDEIVEDSFDLKDYGNSITEQGKSLEVTATTIDTDELDKYKLRQLRDTAYNVTTSGTLNDIAADAISTSLEKIPVYDIKLVKEDPYTGLYTVGDRIKFQFTDTDLGIDLDDYFRIIEINISLDEYRVEQTTLKVALDRPNYTNKTTGFEKLIQSVVSMREELIEVNKQ